VISKLSSARRLRAVIIGTVSVAALIGVFAQMSHAQDMPVAKPAETAVMDETAVRRVVEDVIRSRPELIAEVLNKYFEEQRRMAEANKQRGYDNLEAAFFGDGQLPYVGAKDAPIEVVYFYDINCPHCKRMGQVIQRVMRERDDVKIVHREIPILGPESVYAARLEEATWLLFPEHYKDFNEQLKAFPERLDAPGVDQILAEVVGAEKAEQIKASILENSKAQDQINDNLALANQAGINGTPFLKIRGGRAFEGAVDYETFTAALDEAAKK